MRYAKQGGILTKDLDLKIKKQVDKNHEEMVNFLQQLLRIDSETGKEKKHSRFFREIFT